MNISLPLLTVTSPLITFIVITVMKNDHYTDRHIQYSRHHLHQTDNIIPDKHLYMIMTI